MKSKLDEAKKLLKSARLKDKASNIKRFLGGLFTTDSGDYSLWKATKKINRSRFRESPLRAITGNWAKSNVDKARALQFTWKKCSNPSIAKCRLNFPYVGLTIT